MWKGKADDWQSGGGSEADCERDESQDVGVSGQCRVPFVVPGVGGVSLDTGLSLAVAGVINVR
jgi:hypothetical protein